MGELRGRNLYNTNSKTFFCRLFLYATLQLTLCLKQRNHTNYVCFYVYTPGGLYN